MSDTLGMLQELLEQDQFELPDPEEAKKTGTLHLVYLMNDAVESFLVFQDARMTGTYKKDYEEELEYSLSQDRETYILSVWQGDSVVTVLFRALELEVHLYNYGEIGHFWVKGWEYLRQLEYRIAILRDKYEYLGAEFCTPGEQKIAQLCDFPPLNCSCYPAVPEKYLVPRENVWEPTEAAVDVMEGLAVRAGDTKLQKMLNHYRTNPDPANTRRIASVLRKNVHADTIDLLSSWIKEEAAMYPNRSFGEETDRQIQTMLQQAEEKRAELEKKGSHAEVLREEPFTTARDHLDFQVYLMIWKKGIFDRTVTVECYRKERACGRLKKFWKRIMDVKNASRGKN